jgi:hypothetical protein
MDQNIRGFIEAAKSKGATDETVGKLLKEVGWSEKQVNRATLELYEEKTGSAHGWALLHRLSSRFSISIFPT